MVMRSLGQNPTEAEVQVRGGGVWRGGGGSMRRIGVQLSWLQHYARNLLLWPVPWAMSTKWNQSPWLLLINKLDTVGNKLQSYPAMHFTHSLTWYLGPLPRAGHDQ